MGPNGPNEFIFPNVLARIVAIQLTSYSTTPSKLQDIMINFKALKLRIIRIKATMIAFSNIVTINIAGFAVIFKQVWQRTFFKQSSTFWWSKCEHNLYFQLIWFRLLRTRPEK